MDTDREKGAEVVRAAIKASGLSATEWAKTVALREPRTVRRWVSGESPVPEVVIDWLREQKKPRRKR